MKRNLIIQSAITLLFFILLSPLLGFNLKNWGISIGIAFICSLIIDLKKK